MNKPTVVGVTTGSQREWMDENGNVHRSRRSYYELAVHLPDRNETILIPVPATPDDPRERIAAILEALS